MKEKFLVKTDPPKKCEQAVEQIQREQKRYSKDFFSLQVEFAKRVSELAGINREKAFLDYTTLANIVLGRERREGDGVIDQFLTNLLEAYNPAEIMHSKYLETQKINDEEADNDYFGCFCYSYMNEQIELHFIDQEIAEKSPLSHKNIEKRKEELGVMVADIKKKCPDAKTFRSSTWLNNIPTYASLLPETLRNNLKEEDGKYHRLSLWGQFLKRDGNIREVQAREFREKIKQAKNLTDIENAFPLKVLGGECDIQDLYNQYAK